MKIGFDISALWSWAHFVVFNVLPVAFTELLHWFHEWQILFTGLLMLVAARIWGKSIIRAARINARAAKLAASAEIPWKTSPRGPKVVPASFAATGGARAEPGMKKTPGEPKSELADRLFALREQIRAVLGKTPCTDEVLNPDRLADCRRIAAFALGDVPANAPKLLAHRFDVLRSELSALGAVRETDTCRNAWEALVRISVDARDLVGSDKAAPAKTAAK